MIKGAHLRPQNRGVWKAIRPRWFRGGETRNHRVKHYKNRKACQGCALRAKCTNNKNGRFIERSIYQEALEENQKRVDENPEYYKLRQQITEHQFGTMKRQWGFTFTLMKGKQHVLTEVNLMMMCYHLRRLMSIFGSNELQSRLKGLVIRFLDKNGLNSFFLSSFFYSPSLWEVD